MNNKKEQAEANKDKMKRLERRYAKWKEKQRLHELLETEEFLIDEPDYLDLDLERHW